MAYESLQLPQLLAIMQQERGHIPAIRARGDLWTDVQVDIEKAARSLHQQNAALEPQWAAHGDPAGALFTAKADKTEKEIGEQHTKILEGQPWKALWDLADGIERTYLFVEAKAKEAAALQAQLDALNSSDTGADYFAYATRLAAQIEDLRKAAIAEMDKLDRDFKATGDALKAAAPAVPGTWAGGVDIGPGAPLPDPTTGPTSPAGPPGGTTPPDASAPSAPGGPSGPPASSGGPAPSLSGGPSTPTLPPASAPTLPSTVPPGATGPGTIVPPFIPPVGTGTGTGGNNKVPSMASVLRPVGVQGAGVGPVSLAQAAVPVPNAQPAMSVPPPALPPAAGSATPASAAGAPAIPPMMPPMAGVGGGPGGTGPRPGAVRPSPTGRGPNRNPTPGLPAVLSGKAGKATENAITVRSRAPRIREAELPASVELIDEDLWHVENGAGQTKGAAQVRGR